jgi:hypothetical protein
MLTKEIKKIQKVFLFRNMEIMFLMIIRKQKNQNRHLMMKIKQMLILLLERILKNWIFLKEMDTKGTNLNNR